jgi:hypothetical protein
MAPKLDQVESNRVASQIVANLVKVLPQPKENLLRPFGYDLALPEAKRHSALREAFRKLNKLEVLRHLILIQNLTTTNTLAKTRLAKDVVYLRKIYDKSRSKSKSKSRKK